MIDKFRPILFAEDNPFDAELTLRALASANISNEVVHVVDGVGAMDFLRCEGAFTGRPPLHPVLVLLDIKMPRMDGLDVLRAIREDSKLKFIPVVMLTSSREDQDLLSTYKQGTNAYVVKPVKFTDFLVAIKEIGIFWGLVNETPIQED